MTKKLLIFAFFITLFLLTTVKADSTPILVDRTASTETYRNPDGSFTKTIYSGETFIDLNKGVGIPNYVPMESKYFSIIPTTKTNYAFQLNNTFTNYNAYFKSNSNTASAVHFEKDGYFFEYDVSGGALQWREQPGFPSRTDTLGGGVPSNSKDTTLKTDGNTVIYPDAFSNTHLTYELSRNMLKETFILYKLPSIKEYTYLEYTGNIKFNKTLSICADDVCYVPKGTQDDFNTSGRITFKDTKNKTIFFLQPPEIKDSLNNTIAGVYSVHGSDAQMNFWLRIPTKFLKNATFPVYIDPSITFTSDNSRVLRDAYVGSHDASTNYGSSTAMSVGNTTYYGGESRAYIAFNMSHLNLGSIYTLTDAKVSLYASGFYVYQKLANHSLYYINNSDSWTENGLTWNNQPCGVDFDNSVNCTLNSISQANVTGNSRYINFSVTDIINLTINNNYNNISFAIRDDYLDINRTISYQTKEASSNNPKLILTYISYLSAESPVSLRFYESSNKINFNVSGELDLDTCYWSVDYGATNYSMASKNLTYFYNTTLGASLNEGTQTIIAYCNLTASGNWVYSYPLTFTKDTVLPLISFGVNSASDCLNSSLNWIYANVSVTETNPANITFNLRNSTASINTSYRPSGTRALNWTNLPDEDYYYNITFMDNATNINSTADRKVTIDTTKPYINITSLTAQEGNMNISFTTDYTELHCNDTFFSVFDIMGAVHNNLSNISLSCSNSNSSFLINSYATYSLKVYMRDSAGNENYSTESFTANASSLTITGGGGGSVSNTIPVIGLNNIQSPTKEYNPLQREIIYAAINNYCSNKVRKEPLAVIDYSDSCTLHNTDISLIAEKLKEYNVYIPQEDLNKFYELYKTGNSLFQGAESQETINEYKLFTSVLGILTPLTLNPPSIDSPVLINNPPPEKGLTIANIPVNSNYTIISTILSNKPIASCEPVDNPDVKCEIQNTTLKISYYVNDTNFLSKIFTATLAITTDASPDKVEQKKFSVTYRMYNMGYEPIPGVPFYILAIFLIIIPGGYLLLFKKRGLKKTKAFKEVIHI